MKIVTTIVCLVGCLLISAPETYATPHPDPLRQMAASIARAGEITDAGQVAMILHDVIGADLVRSTDFFGRSEMAAGQIRFTLDERTALARKGLEVALLIRHDIHSATNADMVSAKSLGEIKAELDINDWGVISSKSWRQVANELGKLYTSVVLPDTPGLPSFELPASACCRMIMTVAPHKSETAPVWFVHITQYDIRRKI